MIAGTITMLETRPWSKTAGVQEFTTSIEFSRVPHYQKARELQNLIPSAGANCISSHRFTDYGYNIACDNVF
jgi:hypothetical protein